MTEPTPLQPPEISEWQLVTAWPEELASQATPVNQAVFSWDGTNEDAVYVSFGHVAPPLWPTPEIAQQRMEALGNVIAIQPKGSFLMTRTRAEEIWRAFGKHLGLL